MRDTYRLLLDIEAKQDRILKRLDDILGREILMSQELTDLQAQVAETTDAEQSAIVLLQGLKAALDAAIASGDPAALKKLSADLGASQSALAAAVLQNTPAAPPAPAP